MCTTVNDCAQMRTDVHDCTFDQIKIESSLVEGLSAFR